MLPDGALTVVIGDVSGHDRQAAATMAQVRNLLRGVSYTLQRSPARALSGPDQAMHVLAVDVFAPTVPAQVEQGLADAAAELRTLRWSNAGHPPPVLITPDGPTRLLDTPPDLLLGLAPETTRDGSPPPSSPAPASCSTPTASSSAAEHHCRTACSTS